MVKSKNPKISIIVPAYNVERQISRCIDSLLQQEYTNLEIIIIDDGSSDHTVDIIDNYALLDDRVKVVHQENKGLIAVRDIGIEIADGEYIGFVDGDDSVSADMYGRLLENALEYDAEISVCGIRYLFDQGDPIDHWGTGSTVLLNRTEAVEALIIGKEMEPSLCNKLYKKEIIINSCIDKKIEINEDLIRNYCIFNRARKVVFEDFCGYMYYRRWDSMSNNSDTVKISKDLLEAQELLANTCDDEFSGIIRRSNLEHAVAIINRLSGTKSREAADICQKCRRTVYKNRKHLREMAFMQRMEAYLILLSIRLYPHVYKFLKIFDKRRI